MQRLHKAFPGPFISRVFTRTFLLFFLCFTVPVVAVSTVVLFRTGANLRAEQMTKTEQSFDASALALDADLARLRSVTYPIRNTRWVGKILGAKEGNVSAFMTPYDRYAARKDVKNYMDMVGIADGIALCFPEQDAVFSDIWYDNFDTYFASDMKFHGYSAADFRKLLVQRCNVTTLPVTDVIRLGRGTARYVTMMQTFSPDGGWEDGTMLFYLSEQSLLSYFSEALGQGAQLEIDGESGQSLLHTDACKGRSFSLSRDLLYSGWKVSVQVPYASNNMLYQALMRYALLIVLFIFVAGTLLAYFMARRDYKPLYEITQDMTQDDEEQNAEEAKQVDEFAVMRKNIDRMRDEIRLYKRRVGETSLLAKHRCVEQLLDAVTPQCDIALNSLAAMGITLPHECFRCVLLSCAEQATQREDADAVLSCEGFVTLTAMMGDSLVIVTNYTPTESAWDAFADRLQTYLSEVEIVPLLTVIGTQKNTVSELQDSYQDALMALNTHILTEVGLHKTENTWIWAKEAGNDEERAGVRFDLKQEETLSNLLKAGDAQSAVQMAKDIMEENGSISPEAVRTLFLLLMVLPFRVLDESVTSLFTEQLRATGHVDSVESMLQRISKLYKAVCESQLSTIQNYDDHLMTWIMQYVQENVLRSDISLKLLSEEFSLSVSQISRLFKKATGTGFSEWVNDRRIEEAKRLLRGHLVPLSEIPARCGFTNDITFRRVFKKCTGMTPSDWRDIDANEQNK